MAVLDTSKKLSSRPICTSVYYFQSSLVWLRLLVLMNGCLCFGFFSFGLGVVAKQNTKQSSVRDPCVKWDISQPLVAWNMFLKNKGQSKKVLNFYPLDMSISLEMISVHTETCRGFKLSTTGNLFCLSFIFF